MHARALLSAALSVALALAAATAAAQAPWPSKPIRVVIPLPAGGIVDIVGRAVTEKVSAALGQPLVVENRPGANSNIGIDAVHKATPDGYTWMIAGPAVLSNPAIYPDLPWQPERDFTATGLLVWTQNIAVVPASLPVHSLREFAAYAKARPGQLHFANPGSGASNHLQTELFRHVAGIDLIGVGYKGQPPAIPDLINAQIAFMVPSVGLVQQHIASGRLRALATFTHQRLKSMPELPTVAEAGYPEAVVVPWFGAYVSSRVPRDITQKINAAISAALRAPDVIERLEKSGSLPGPAMSLAELEKSVRSDMAQYAKVVKVAGIKPE